MSTASELIQGRLKKVWRTARKAAKRRDKDGTLVHELRVATRRAVAALDTYRPWLPAQDVDWLVRQLTRMRRTAGKARNWDILHTRLADPATPVDPTATPLLLAWIDELQSKARKPIRAAVRRLRRKQFQQRCQAFPRRVLASLDARALDADFSCQSMQPWVEAFLRAARSDISDIEHLHSIRIRGKVLRYAIEIKQELLDDLETEATNRILTDIHSRLGVLNDHVTMSRLLAKLLHKSKKRNISAFLQRLLQREQLQVHATHHDFVRWWSQRRIHKLEQCLAQTLQSCESPIRRTTRKHKSS